MSVQSLLFLVSVITSIELGNSLQCYHCHQTSPECINGVKSRLDILNCSESNCFVLKYETQMPGVAVLATYRGCKNMELNKMMEFVQTEKQIVKTVHYHLCNYTLCNSASKIMYSAWYFVCFLLYYLIL